MSDSFLEHFENIVDPRIERCKKHQLLDILLLAISAVISGAEGWEDIEDFGHNRLDWLRKYRPFLNGIPRHDTIARVITKLRADEIEQAFQSWMKTLVQTTGTDIIAVDGKTARHSFDTRGRKNPLHSVSAWSCSNQLVLGQAAVDDKSNEITAIPKLLTLLDIENCIITLDAMGCQRKIAKQIVQSKADYVLALKGNHSTMQAELEAWWHKACREQFTEKNYAQHTDVDAGHGRIETRHCEHLVVDKEWLTKQYQWEGLRSIIKITSEVEHSITCKVSKETRWYISSLELDAEQALKAVRGHWQVESMHWMLDMTFREDECRIRKGNGALAFNALRKIALNLFKFDTTQKMSMARKKKNAALNDEYRSVLLESAVKMR
ncbi:MULTISPECIES: ISAs1 family transposase [Vibrio]|uniref:ISAs1 family transposase n=2 Tax=Vibrionaceae TaxID=641 RepID=UPI000D34E91E|nr:MULTISPECIES: ISAs1 family transposase [unclassified Vibrio]PTO94805.1 ISAs1 family transposase [Vibrio sp. 10N.286.45.A3]PTP02582.1 ISAs1 family transposase [Vibrio sp. 10N.286.45.A3]PTQ14984.1 ISAs1 family transposase [Vibrio sp. 10N.286.46.E10]